jgi:hypothetical protein
MFSNSAPSAFNTVHRRPHWGNVAWIAAGALMGVVTGYVFGATLGGIWAAQFSVGRLDGAVVTGLGAALVGGVVVGGLSYWLSLRHQAAVVVWGFAGAMVGMSVGLLVGANIGGNWVTGLSIGSLHGTEATGMLGLVLGGITVAILGIWIGRRVRSGTSTPR